MSMKLELNLHELLELKSALAGKKHRIEKEIKNADERTRDLIDTESLETIDTLLNKLDVLFKEL